MIYWLRTASRIFPDFLQWGNARRVINLCRYSSLRILQLFHRLILLIPLVCVSAAMVFLDDLCHVISPIARLLGCSRGWQCG